MPRLQHCVAQGGLGGLRCEVPHRGYMACCALRVFHFGARRPWEDLWPLKSGKRELLLRMLHKLQVVCENNCKVRGPTGQCNWTGEYSEYQKHRASCQNLQSAEGPASDSQHEPASSSTALADLQPEAPDNTQQQPPQMHVRFKQGDQWCSPEVVLRAPPLGSMNPLEGGTFSKLDLHKPPVI